MQRGSTPLMRPPVEPITDRKRIVFAHNIAKTGLLRFLSHRELIRVFQRAIARIQAPIAYSQGFHPHPQMAFGPALPVGTEGSHENMSISFFLSNSILKIL